MEEQQSPTERVLQTKPPSNNNRTIIMVPEEEKKNDEGGAFRMEEEPTANHHHPKDDAFKAVTAAAATAAATETTAAVPPHHVTVKPPSQQQSSSQQHQQQHVLLDDTVRSETDGGDDEEEDFGPLVVTTLDNGVVLPSVTENEEGEGQEHSHHHHLHTMMGHVHHPHSEYAHDDDNDDASSISESSSSSSEDSSTDSDSESETSSSSSSSEDEQVHVNRVVTTTTKTTTMAAASAAAPATPLVVVAAAAPDNRNKNQQDQVVERSSSSSSSSGEDSSTSNSSSSEDGSSSSASSSRSEPEEEEEESSSSFVSEDEFEEEFVDDDEEVRNNSNNTSRSTTLPIAASATTTQTTTTTLHQPVKGFYAAAMGPAAVPIPMEQQEANKTNNRKGFFKNRRFFPGRRHKSKNNNTAREVSTTTTNTSNHPQPPTVASPLTTLPAVASTNATTTTTTTQEQPIMTLPVVAAAHPTSAPPPLVLRALTPLPPPNKGSTQDSSPQPPDTTTLPTLPAAAAAPLLQSQIQSDDKIWPTLSGAAAATSLPTWPAAAPEKDSEEEEDSESDNDDGNSSSSSSKSSSSGSSSREDESSEDDDEEEESSSSDDDNDDESSDGVPTPLDRIGHGVPHHHTHDTTQVVPAVAEDATVAKNIMVAPDADAKEESSKIMNGKESAAVATLQDEKEITVPVIKAAPKNEENMESFSVATAAAVDEVVVSTKDVAIADNVVLVAPTANNVILPDELISGVKGEESEEEITTTKDPEAGQGGTTVKIPQVNKVQDFQSETVEENVIEGDKSTIVAEEKGGDGEVKEKNSEAKKDAQDVTSISGGGLFGSIFPRTLSAKDMADASSVKGAELVASTTEDSVDHASKGDVSSTEGAGRLFSYFGRKKGSSSAGASSPSNGSGSSVSSRELNMEASNDVDATMPLNDSASPDETTSDATPKATPMQEKDLAEHHVHDTETSVRPTPSLSKRNILADVAAGQASMEENCTSGNKSDDDDSSTGSGGDVSSSSGSSASSSSSSSYTSSTSSGSSASSDGSDNGDDSTKQVTTTLAIDAPKSSDSSSESNHSPSSVLLTPSQPSDETQMLDQVEDSHMIGSEKGIPPVSLEENILASTNQERVAIADGPKSRGGFFGLFGRKQYTSSEAETSKAKRSSVVLDEINDRFVVETSTLEATAPEKLKEALDKEESNAAEAVMLAVSSAQEHEDSSNFDSSAETHMISNKGPAVEAPTEDTAPPPPLTTQEATPPTKSKKSRSFLNLFNRKKKHTPLDVKPLTTASTIVAAQTIAKETPTSPNGSESLDKERVVTKNEIGAFHGVSSTLGKAIVESMDKTEVTETSNSLVEDAAATAILDGTNEIRNSMPTEEWTDGDEKLLYTSKEHRRRDSKQLLEDYDSFSDTEADEVTALFDFGLHIPKRRREDDCSDDNSDQSPPPRKESGSHSSGWSSGDGYSSEEKDVSQEVAEDNFDLENHPFGMVGKMQANNTSPETNSAGQGMSSATLPALGAQEIGASTSPSSSAFSIDPVYGAVTRDENSTNIVPFNEFYVEDSTEEFKDENTVHTEQGRSLDTSVDLSRKEFYDKYGGSILDEPKEEAFEDEEVAAGKGGFLRRTKTPAFTDDAIEPLLPTDSYQIHQGEGDLPNAEEGKIGFASRGVEYAYPDDTFLDDYHRRLPWTGVLFGRTPIVLCLLCLLLVVLPVVIVSVVLTQRDDTSAILSISTGSPTMKPTSAPTIFPTSIPTTVPTASPTRIVVDNIFDRTAAPVGATGETWPVDFTLATTEEPIELLTAHLETNVTLSVLLPTYSSTSLLELYSVQDVFIPVGSFCPPVNDTSIIILEYQSTNVTSNANTTTTTESVQVSLEDTDTSLIVCVDNAVVGASYHLFPNITIQDEMYYTETIDFTDDTSLNTTSVLAVGPGVGLNGTALVLIWTSDNVNVFTRNPVPSSSDVFVHDIGNACPPALTVKPALYQGSFPVTLLRFDGNDGNGDKTVYACNGTIVKRMYVDYVPLAIIDHDAAVNATNGLSQDLFD